MGRTIFVIAPSQRYFALEAKKRFGTGGKMVVVRTGGRVWTVDGDHYNYVSRPDDLRGYTGVEVECWGPPPRGYDNVDWAAQIAVVTRP